MTLGQNIQNARRAQGLSQEALAEKIGVSRQALGKWEKDTALPGLDNLQALAAALGIGVDALLGAENADPAVPAVTLDALRDLLAARDAEEKRRRRLWGCAGGVAFIVLAGLLAGVALQYERQISALNQNYAAIQSSYAAQQAELSAQISELQDAVRMGEATVLTGAGCPWTSCTGTPIKAGCPCRCRSRRARTATVRRPGWLCAAGTIRSCTK